jgi:hypothetical protein
MWKASTTKPVALAGIVEQAHAAENTIAGGFPRQFDSLLALYSVVELLRRAYGPLLNEARKSTGPYQMG